MGRIDEKELEQKLRERHSTLSLKLSEVDFRKLAFALWIADASTLAAVNKKNRAVYRPLFEKLDQLNFMGLSEIIAAKKAIHDTQRQPGPRLTIPHSLLLHSTAK